MTDNQVRRIAVFYDGSFFQRFNFWCRRTYRQYVDFQGLHDYLAWYIAEKIEGSKNKFPLFRIVEAHYFQGRFSIEAAMKKGEEEGKPFVYKGKELPPIAYYLAKDRIIDQVLMHGNLTTHYYPMNESTDPPREKGIDVWLSLEAYDIAVHKRFDYLVLFGGDEDFVPLIRKVNSLDIATIVIGLDIDSKSQTSQRLIKEASYHIFIDQKMTESQKKASSLDKDEKEMLQEILRLLT